MDLGHAIDGVGAHDAQVGHVDPLLPALLNERHTAQTIVIARKLGRNSLHGRKEEFSCLFYVLFDVDILKKKKEKKACNALDWPLDGDD